MDELKLKYRAMWDQAEDAVRSGTYQPDPAPQHGEPRWGLSLVALVDGEVRDKIEDDLARLVPQVGAQHFVYSPQDLHMTVRSLEGYQDAIPPAQVDFYRDQVAQLLRTSEPLEVEFEGLCASRGGVLVCGYPSASLSLLRSRLHELGEQNGPRAVASNDYQRSRDTAHISLAVFQAPAEPEPDLADFVAARRERFYGVIKTSTLALVSYERVAVGYNMHRVALVEAA